MPALSPKSSYARRLRQAREAAQMSQKGLGIAAGLDKFIASTRVNRYEQGVHEPDTATGSRLARVDLPLAYFYADSDELAEIIMRFHRSSAEQRHAAFQVLAPQSDLRHTDDNQRPILFAEIGSFPVEMTPTHRRWQKRGRGTNMM